MTIYDRPAAMWPSLSPAVCLALCLALATGLVLLPRRATQFLRQTAGSALRPGLLVVSGTRSCAHQSLGIIGNLGAGTRRAAQLERELEQVRQHAGQLEAEIVWLRSIAPHSADPEATSLRSLSPLLRPRMATARVLGRYAQHFLHTHSLLDAGSQAGLSAGNLVLDASPVLVDHGAFVGASRGQLVTAGRRVWGKLTEVQPRMSTVLQTTDIGFSDLVCLAQPSGEGLTLGPRGVLQGVGEPLCRLEQVPITQAVAVDQWVVTTGGEGLLDGVFLYGRVERVEQSQGSAHWDIWVRPAITHPAPHDVAVLTADSSVAGRNTGEVRQ